MAWHPVLDGALADAARTTVLEIARAIAAREGRPAAVTDRALFWAYVAGAFDDAWIANEYDTAITELVDSAPRWLGSLSLYGGAAGFGFAVAHISEPAAADASLAAIDSLIADELAVEAWTGDYDLISGLAGIGVYLIERGGAGCPMIDRVVHHLLATSACRRARQHASAHRRGRSVAMARRATDRGCDGHALPAMDRPRPQHERRDS